MSTNRIGGVYRRKKNYLMEEEEKHETGEESEDEISLYTAAVKKEGDQKVPLLHTRQPTENTNTAVKHIVVIRDDGDSGISESASEESNPLTELSHGTITEKKEGILGIVVQIFIPFMIAGFGMMFAGFLLDYVQVLSRSMITI